ncbi:MAG: T9SS type A sorting domain-containing protein [Flavobacteriaceae bacterium]|nr:T9SS type A sorting domain-containing protein [Flavobacteriaceae bacterium]RZW57584.1 MAG: T9SS type A sorting domain-containing protein [Flavobacteriaceae bacterium]
MKTNLLCVCLLFTMGIGAQTDFSIDEIAESEAKSAQVIHSFRANANTGNYNLTYHRLEFDIDPSVAYISGDITSYFIAKEDLSEVTFDLDDNLTVSQVMQRGSALSFVQNSDDELIITLPQVQNQGILDSLTVSYSGNPVSSGFGSFEQTTHNNDPIIWTLSEPYGAKAWWPCKQDLNDKIDSIDVFLTTPLLNPTNETYIAVSNGVEQSQTINGNFKTTHFRHQYAIPAYLIAIAVTNYDIFTQQVPNNGNPFDIVNYVFPETLAEAQIDTEITVDIMNLFTDLFEEYPFADEKYGHAQFGWGGGMEHTTVSFMGNFSRNLIAHELAHQWFGNKITCGSWKDIWLNEGFATYLSGLVIEDFDENSDFTAWKEGRINHITSHPVGHVYLTDSDTTNVSRIFNGRLSYNKGAMVLHMLRKKLGDTNFFQGMKDYLSHPDHAYGYAKTEDYIAIMEQASGLDLTEFFDDWIYNEGYPSFTITWNQISPTQVMFDVEQTQSHETVSFFEALLPIRVIGTEGQVMNYSLDHTQNGEQFFRDVNFTIASVEFDPEFDVISKDNQVLLSDEEFIIDSEFMVFPNPAETTVHIRKPSTMEISKVLIFNTLGQLISQQTFSDVIRIDHLSSGVHFFRFETNQGNIYKSVIKN